MMNVKLVLYLPQESVNFRSFLHLFVIPILLISNRFNSENGWNLWVCLIYRYQSLYCKVKAISSYFTSPSAFISLNKLSDLCLDFKLAINKLCACLEAWLYFFKEGAILSKMQSLFLKGFNSNDALPYLSEHLFSSDQLVTIVRFNLASYESR
jgi:hypothetical protein